MLKKLKYFLRAEIDPAFAKRAEIIFQYIEKYKSKRILDAGCGRGFYLYGINSYKFVKEIHGIDINEKYLKIAKNINQDKRVKIKKSNIYKLPYENNSFDLIICSEVLEHLKDDKKALKELHRVLKPNGKLIITVPNLNFPFFWDPLNWFLMHFFNKHINKNIWWLAGIWADHERLYNKNDLKKIIKQTGFKIIKVKEIIHWCWPFSHFILYGIGKNLVEKMNLNEFNRFNFKSNKLLSRIIAYFFRLPSKIFDEKIKLSNSVNLLVLAIKNKQIN